jgi:putative pyruvate formate lyase activating enzyme
MTMKCNLCRRLCNIDRSHGVGRCGLDDNIYISYYGPHFGEEPFLVGQGGSGTIFFMGCNLRCAFCQNHQISRWTIKDKTVHAARQISSAELTRIFLELRDNDCANINLVSPTPYAHHIAAALAEAKKKGLAVPVVYNSHGYDAPEALNIMSGMVDIYLPDLKYGSDELGETYSGVPRYFTGARQTIVEMLAQAGHLTLDADEMAVKGLAVRHLVLPGHVENSLKALDFLASLGKETAVSLMSQYHPLPSLPGIPPELNRTLRREEYDRVVDHALDLCLENCLIQELSSHEKFLPDFNAEDCFKK